MPIEPAKSSFPTRAAPAETSARLMPSFTLVVWMSCLIVGGVGLLLPERPSQFLPKSPSIQPKIINVQITNGPALPNADLVDMAADAEPTLPDADPPPAMPAVANESAAPPLAAVVKLTPSIAFALPTPGPTQVTADPKQAVPTRSPATGPAITTAPAGPPAVRHIIYGQGEGVQPAPDYPREAIIARQQGVVVVRFTVGEDGRVQDAEAVKFSPFAILNQAAVRSVRETWRFGPGDVRAYEVSIEFVLKPRK